MQVLQSRPLGLSQSRPTSLPGGRTCPGHGLRSRAWHPVLQARRQAANILQAAKTEEAPAKAAPQVASAKASAPAAKGTAPALTPQDLDRVILMQGFGWDACEKGNWYETLKSQIPELQKAGITHFWLPPPSQSVAHQGYLPGQLYNLNSKYGNREQLVALNKALKAAGIVPVCDVVINHRCADQQDEHGVWNRFGRAAIYPLDDVTHKGEKIDWGAWAITGDDPEFRGTGNPDTGDDYGPAPDLDHTNEDLRSHIKEWLNWLKDDIGFEGWRFDFVKGYGPQFIKEYVMETVGAQSYNVGEFWVDCRWNGADLDHNQDPARQALCDYLDGVGGAAGLFDFPMKGILQEAVKHTQYWRLRDGAGKPPGLLGWWPTRATVFIKNHDTDALLSSFPGTQQHWPFPAEKTETGYAYVLTHPGTPCIFYDDLWSHGDKLRELIALRKRADITARSSVEIRCADADMYLACIDKKVIVKLGPRYDMGDLLPKEQEGWKVAVSGIDFCVWEKAGDGA